MCYTYPDRGPAFPYETTGCSGGFAQVLGSSRACMSLNSMQKEKNRENKNNNLACSLRCNGEIFAPLESTKLNYTRFAINLDKMGPLKRNQNKNQFLMYSQSCLLEMYTYEKNTCAAEYLHFDGETSLRFNGLSTALPASRTRRLQTKKKMEYRCR